MADRSPMFRFGGSGDAILVLKQMTAAGNDGREITPRNLSPSGAEQGGNRDVSDIQQHGTLSPSLHGTRQRNGRRENILRINAALYLHQPLRIAAVATRGAIRIIPAEQVRICAR